MPKLASVYYRLFICVVALTDRGCYHRPVVDLLFTGIGGWESPTLA